jgi:uncharacterized protein YdbL (DUF1318 family)
MRRTILAAVLLLNGCSLVNQLLQKTVNQVDRNTSLEQQAAGAYPDIAREIDEAGIQPGPVPLTTQQVDTAKKENNVQTTEEVSDSARIDEFLKRRCIGEALEGTLAVTPETCAGKAEPTEITHLVEDANRSRLAVWKYLASLHPDAKDDVVREAWRATRLRAVTCGAQLQAPDGKWEVKKC